MDTIHATPRNIAPPTLPPHILASVGRALAEARALAAELRPYIRAEDDQNMPGKQTIGPPLLRAIRALDSVADKTGADNYPFTYFSPACEACDNLRVMVDLRLPLRADIPHRPTIVAQVENLADNIRSIARRIAQAEGLHPSTYEG